MDPKTFKAETAKEVLSQISRELGPDAIIVSQKKIKDSEGILWVEATASPREGSAVDTAAFSNALTSALKRKKSLMIGGLAAMFALIVAAAVIFWPRGGEVPTPKQKRIVVLPFENLGPPEDVYFADGITDEITTRLARMDGLGVIARTSAYQYKNKDKGIQQIGDELEVDYVLEGTVRWQRSPDDLGRIRISPQLIRADDATHVWAHIYDEDITDIFEVQSNISEQVAEALDISLLESERQALKARPTDNVEAYNYYLRGKDYFHRGFSPKDIRMAIQMFEKAVELDPTFALAYTQLSYNHSSMYGNRWDRTEERLAKAKQAVDKAFQLRPDMPEAHGAMGGYYKVQNDSDRAMKHLKIAQESMPNDSQILLTISIVQGQQGKGELALATLKKALELDPRSSVLAYQMAVELRGRRRYSEAESFYDLAISLAPENWLYYHEKAELYLLWEGSTEKARKVFEDVPKFVRSSGEPLLYKYMAYRLAVFDGNYQGALDQISSVSSKAVGGRVKFLPIELMRAQIYRLMNQPELAESHYESARRFLETRIQAQPADARLHGSLGIAYAGLGRKEEAIREGKLAVELESAGWFALFRLEELAQIYTMIGEHDQAIDQLEYLLSHPYEYTIPLFRIDPKWNPLREHPRFQKLLEEGK